MGKPPVKLRPPIAEEAEGGAVAADADADERGGGHASVVCAAGGKQSAHPFGHGREHRLPDGRLLVDSYHTSRYNQNTGVLTPAMFEAVIERALQVRQL